MDWTFKQLLRKVEHEDLRLIGQIKQYYTKKTAQEVKVVYNFCDYWGKRLWNQERYSSNNSALVQNPSFEANKQEE